MGFLFPRLSLLFPSSLGIGQTPYRNSSNETVLIILPGRKGKPGSEAAKTCKNKGLILTCLVIDDVLSNESIIFGSRRKDLPTPVCRCTSFLRTYLFVADILDSSDRWMDYALLRASKVDDGLYEEGSGRADVLQST